MISAEEFIQAAQTHGEGLYRIGLSILKQRADAQDAVQETLLKTWQARSRCRSESLRPFMARILVNECRNIQRKRQREFPVAQLPENNNEQNLSDHSNLKESIDKLSEALRTPLLIHYMEGWPDKEIASALGISAIAVRNRLYRARKKLKTILREEGGQEK